MPAARRCLEGAEGGHPGARRWPACGPPRGGCRGVGSWSAEDVRAAGPGLASTRAAGTGPGRGRSRCRRSPRSKSPVRELVGGDRPPGPPRRSSTVNPSAVQSAATCAPTADEDRVRRRGPGTSSSSRARGVLRPAMPAVALLRPAGVRRARFAAAFRSCAIAGLAVGVEGPRRRRDQAVGPAREPAVDDATIRSRSIASRSALRVRGVAEARDGRAGGSGRPRSASSRARGASRLPGTLAEASRRPPGPARTPRRARRRGRPRESASASSKKRSSIRSIAGCVAPLVGGRPGRRERVDRRLRATRSGPSAGAATALAGSRTAWSRSSSTIAYGPDPTGCDPNGSSAIAVGRRCRARRCSGAIGWVASVERSRRSAGRGRSGPSADRRRSR